MHAPEPMPDALFLSRLSLNLRNREVRADLANSQALHRRMLDAFPQASRAGNGLLYRVDPVGESFLNGAVVLVQSEIAPDWSCLPEGYIVVPDGYGLDLDGDVPTKEISASYDSIQSGDLCRFRLRASPTKRIPWNIWASEHPENAAKIIQAGRKPVGPRVPVTILSPEERKQDPPPTAEDKLREWIVRKGRDHGFLVADLVIRPDPLTGDMQRGHKRDDNGEKLEISHKAIVYDGVLKVTDLETFHRVLRNGIGGGKAYGFGLLSIRRLRGN